ncbi:MAG: BlaI/MecI/CopY family transcriptional regulator [Oscillospiraceae bacterium]|nr:BlaI/MecI/CopY family transcriptional regulator [Oscillospiraceae bacterium]
MEQYKLGEMEKRFAEIIWGHSPVSTRKLVELREKEFGWKRTTTYTMLKRLCERGIFENNGGTVATVIEKDDFIYRQSQDFIDRTFQGSLPMFLTLFSKNKGLSDDEIAEIQQLIDRYKEGGR